MIIPTTLFYTEFGIINEIHNVLYQDCLDIDVRRIFSMVVL